MCFAHDCSQAQESFRAVDALPALNLDGLVQDVVFGRATAKYGAAMEQVIEYRMITASGEIVIVTEEDVKMVSDEGNRTTLPDDDPRKESDLWFGLRGAGGSFGIVTEFLVKVYPVPETLASVIPVWVSTADDLKLIQQAAESKQVSSLISFGNFITSHLIQCLYRVKDINGASILSTIIVLSNILGPILCCHCRNIFLKFRFNSI